MEWSITLFIYGMEVCTGSDQVFNQFVVELLHDNHQRCLSLVVWCINSPRFPVFVFIHVRQQQFGDLAIQF